MGRRGVLRKLVLATSSGLFALVVAEIAVRQLDVLPLHDPPAEFALNLHHEDPNGLIRLTPGWSGHVSGQWTEINAKGFRDREFEARKAPGVTRIAVFGDSYTMGDGVSLASTYPKQLEALLRAKGLDCEVMNCAVSATNSSNQLHSVRALLAEYEVDFVLLGYNLNDFDNPTLTRFELLEQQGQTLEVDDEGRVRVSSRAKPWHQRLRLGLHARSALYRYLSRRLRASGPGESERSATLARWIAAGDHLRSIEAVDGMRSSCEEAETPFLLVFLPDTLRLPTHFEDIHDYPFRDEHQLVADALADRDIEFIEMLQAFEGHQIGDLEVHWSDPHYNELGHSLIAKKLAEALQGRF